MNINKACSLFGVIHTPRQERKWDDKRGRAYILSRGLKDHPSTYTGIGRPTDEEKRMAMNTHADRSKKEQSPNHH